MTSTRPSRPVLVHISQSQRNWIGLSTGVTSSLLLNQMPITPQTNHMWTPCSGASGVTEHERQRLINHLRSAVRERAGRWMSVVCGAPPEYAEDRGFGRAGRIGRTGRTRNGTRPTEAEFIGTARVRFGRELKEWKSMGGDRTHGEEIDTRTKRDGRLGA